MDLDTGLGCLVFRVAAVTDTRLSSDRNPNHPNFILTTSSPCCCEPTVEMWLTEDGMEDPKSECTLIRPAGRGPHGPDRWRVHFYWDRGWYDGLFELQCWEPKWANARLVGRIYDIGSL
jgi:hypothetical protein